MLQHLLVRAGLFRSNALRFSNELGGEEFKLPKIASLVIVITYNMLLQVRGYAVLVCGFVA